MNIKQLKDFRAKLEHAKKLCELNGFGLRILDEFISAGLSYQCADAFRCYLPKDVWIWYINPFRAPSERKAMWDNSIAAVNMRIAKGK